MIRAMKHDRFFKKKDDILYTRDQVIYITRWRIILKF